MPQDYDDDAAKREGWAVFECDDGKLRIQRLDSPRDAFPELPEQPMFPSDAAALSFVEERARSGSEMHQAALNLNNTSLWV